MSRSGGKKSSGSSSGKTKKNTIDIDPSIIRFTHARIRPYFTGCGKKIEDTIQEIVDGVTTVEDLPLITVIENDGEYFSLNNRRLYTIKHVQGLGLLKKPTIQAFIKPALDREKTRYTAARCALQARIMLEREQGGESDEEAGEHDDEETKPHETHVSELVTDTQSLALSDSAASGSKTKTTTKVSGEAATTEDKSVPPKGSKDVKEKAAKVKSVPIPADILKELKDFSKLVSKGKTKVVLSYIDEWVMAGKINDAQRDEICEIVGLPVSK